MASDWRSCWGDGRLLGPAAHGIIECYVVRDLDQFNVSCLAPVGVREVKTSGGVTFMEISKEGKRQNARSIVYSCARPEVAQHEVIHAYCHQTFGRIGPVWYAEGMAEIGHYWTEGDSAVHAGQREIEFLRDNPPKSLAEPLSRTQTTGDSWQNYALRWALCHFLVSNPNYARQFRQWGRELLAGKDVAFEQAFSPISRQLFFEYLFFLEHIGRGYRVELCAGDWKKKFACLRPDHAPTAIVAAGRGWQPTGLTVRRGTQYEYLAEGAWQIGEKAETVDANGDGDGRGRLVGVLLKDYHLGPEFELGAKGLLQPKTDGDLYLRCRTPWNEVTNDRGRISVTVKASGRAHSGELGSPFGSWTRPQ